MKQGMLDLHKFRKKYLKKILKNVSFQKPPQANEPDHLCNSHLRSIQYDAMDFDWAKSKFSFRISG